MRSSRLRGPARAAAPRLRRAVDADHRSARRRKDGAAGRVREPRAGRRLDHRRGRDHEERGVRRRGWAALSGARCCRPRRRRRWGERCAAPRASSSRFGDGLHRRLGHRRDRRRRRRGLADSGHLSDDLTDLLIALGEAAQERAPASRSCSTRCSSCSPVEFEALITALHRTVQRQLPVTLVGAGLPQLPRLAGEAKSYAERLFKFPHLGRLSTAEAEAALAQPAAELGVAFEPGRVDVIVDYTEGYPYFLQEYGKIVWDLAPGGRADLAARRRGGPARGRGEAGRVLLPRPRRADDRARAPLPARDGRARPRPAPAGDVAAMLGRTSSSSARRRARLIDKGLIYTTGHGRGDFTVPQFDRYLRRNYRACEDHRRQPQGPPHRRAEGRDDPPDQRPDPRGRLQPDRPRRRRRRARPLRRLGRARAGGALARRRARRPSSSPTATRAVRSTPTSTSCG